MPIEVPNLDDRNFADLVEEALAMLPRYAPLWTNHNASDPGITLIELLAYFTEMLTYRLNRVSRENRIQFLQLLNGPAWDARDQLGQASLEVVDTALKDAVLALRERQRAVTQEDFEFLARRATAEHPDQTEVARAHCEFHRNLETSEALRESHQPGHVSVVVVPDDRPGSVELESLVTRVRDYLQPRCLLATRLHVTGPYYLWVSIGAAIRIQAHAAAEDVRKRATDALAQYFNALSPGGLEGTGWPFGRYIYLSEIFDVLERVRGVEYIAQTHVLQLATSEASFRDHGAAMGLQIGVCSTLGVDSRLGAKSFIGEDRLVRNDAGQLVAVVLRPYELVRIVVHEEDIHLVDSAGFAEASEKP